MQTNTENESNKTSQPKLEGHIYGNCPVQVEGTFDGLEWYFRARGNYWSFEMESGKEDETTGIYLYYVVTKPYKEGEPFAAGYMEEHEAWAFIQCALHDIAMGEVKPQSLP